MVTSNIQHQIKKKRGGNGGPYQYINILSITILALERVLILANSLVTETEGPTTLIP
jgi:hypothetical protein